MKKLLKRLLAGIGLLLLALLLIPYLIPIAQYTHDLTGPFDNSAMLDHDGTMIHYRDWQPDGKAKANILLVHGFCGSTYNWVDTVPALTAAGYRVLAMDMPPFGYSDRFPEYGHGLAARNDYAWAAIDAASGGEDGGEASQWWLVGHSMGGGIIEAMAQLNPERTAGLVFANGGGFGAGPGGNGALRAVAGAAMGFGPVRRWAEVYGKHVAFQDDNIRDLCISAAGAPPSDETLKNYLSALRVPQTASAILDMFRGGLGDLDLDAKTIAQPTLIIWGSEDSWVPVHRGEKLHEDIVHSEWVLIDGAHHMPMETHAKIFNAELLAFLERHSKL